MRRFYFLLNAVLAVAVLAGIATIPATAAFTAQTVEILPDACVEADQWLDANIGAITNRQQLYFDQNNIYWQGLTTHEEKPAYDELSEIGQAAKEPDNFDAKPSDQAAGWSDIFPEFAVEKLPASVQFDVYDGPQGAGYTITLSLVFKEITWERVANFGPESHREHGWQQILEADQIK